MAIDSREKRQTALMFEVVWDIPAVNADGSDLDSKGQRQGAIWSYSGITTASAGGAVSGGASSFPALRRAARRRR